MTCDSRVFAFSALCEPQNLFHGQARIQSLCLIPASYASAGYLSVSVAGGPVKEVYGQLQKVRKRGMQLPCSR